MDRNSSIGMPLFPTMKVCIGENFSLKILMPLLVVRRPLFTSIAMHCKILKSCLQNSQISSLLSFRIPLSGIPNGRMLHVILTERSEWKDLLHRLTLHGKKEWKNAHANKNAFAAFPIPLFFVQRCRPERSRRTCSFCRSKCPYVTSSVSQEVCWQRLIPRLLSSGPPLGITILLSASIFD